MGAGAPWEALPFVDEQAVEIAAAPEDVWWALGAALERVGARPGVGTYARAVSARPYAAEGRGLTVGTAYPGFRVLRADQDRELVLVGRHFFSRYALILRLDDLGATGIRLRAATRASFPGPLGAVYRVLVISSGAHVSGLSRLLAGMRRSAEQRAGRTARRGGAAERTGG